MILLWPVTTSLAKRGHIGLQACRAARNSLQAIYVYVGRQDFLIQIHSNSIEFVTSMTDLIVIFCLLLLSKILTLIY